MLTVLLVLVPATAWVVAMVAAPDHAHLVGLVLLAAVVLRVVLAVARARRDGVGLRGAPRRHGGAVRGAADARLVRGSYDLPDVGGSTSTAQPPDDRGGGPTG